MGFAAEKQRMKWVANTPFNICFIFFGLLFSLACIVAVIIGAKAYDDARSMQKLATAIDLHEKACEQLDFALRYGNGSDPFLVASESLFALCMFDWATAATHTNYSNATALFSTACIRKHKADYASTLSLCALGAVASPAELTLSAIPIAVVASQLATPYGFLDPGLGGQNATALSPVTTSAGDFVAFSGFMVLGRSVGLSDLAVPCTAFRLLPEKY